MRARVPTLDLALLYVTCIRSIMDFAIPVFNYSLPKDLKKELECIEKRAMATTYPDLDHQSALFTLGINLLVEHHKDLCSRLFNTILSNPSHKLHGLLPT